MRSQDLRPEDLIPLKLSATVRPRPPTASSVPGLLSLLQNEWDAVMLETFQLKKHLETVRQELAHALYKHDAACRVIARLIKERNEAKRSVCALFSIRCPHPRSRLRFGACALCCILLFTPHALSLFAQRTQQHAAQHRDGDSRCRRCRRGRRRGRWFRRRGHGH